MNGQLPLFDSPASPMRRHSPAPRSSPVQYTRITPKTHTRALCDDCCTDIRQQEQGVAPYPQRATWRRVDDTTSTVLCQAHKEERQTRETH